MKRILMITEVVLIAACIAALTGGYAFAAPPPPPPPDVPAGGPIAQYAVGGGIVAFGAYRLWKEKRAERRNKRGGL